MAILSNARHERFAQELAKGRSATEAYKAAGYEGDRTAASRLSSNVNIQARVAEILQRGAERAAITQEMVLRELAKIGFADIRKAVKWRANVTEMEVDEETGDARMAVSNQVQIIDSDEIDDDTAAAISEIAQSDKGALRIKFHDKKGALVDIGRHLGMFVDRHELTGKDGGPISTEGQITLSDTAAFIAEALGERAEPAPGEPRED